MRTTCGVLRRAIALVGIAAVVGLGLGLGGGAAGAQSADDRPPPAQPRSQLTLLAVPNGGAAQLANLTCEPPGGTHPDPVGSCRDIAAARGNLADLPGDPDVEVCLDIYDPVRVFALGLWRGQPVWFGQTYGNSCELRAATGPVFAITGTGG